MWDLLFARQSEMLQGRAVSDFFKGLDVLRLSRPGIPDFDELNERLFARTGWTIVSVPGLVPDDIFFDHLSKRRFPAGNFIRSRESLDYLEAPDVFHDVFGHVPLLAQPAVADFMQAMGAEGLAALAAGSLHRLARLYWYSVEFGLAREAGETRIYGAGLLSSFGESHFSLESDEPAPQPLRHRAGAAHPLLPERLPEALFHHRQLRRPAASADRRRPGRALRGAGRSAGPRTLGPGPGRPRPDRRAEGDQIAVGRQHQQFALAVGLVGRPMHVARRQGVEPRLQLFMEGVDSSTST